MKKLMEHLSNNPQEALAISEGRALPMQNLKPTELLQLIKTIKFDKESTMLKYW